MPIDDSNRIFDGYSNFVGGADDGRKPHLIDATQFEEAENLICRGGSVTQRLPIRDVALTFDNPDLTYLVDGTYVGNVVTNDSLNNFHLQLFQGAQYYSPEEGENHIMAMIGGRLYQITPGLGQTAHIMEIGLPPKRNRKTIPLAYQVQAGHYHIVQDGEAAPIIYDGALVSRAVTGQIPVGTIMGSGQGRIVLVLPDGSIEFGDIRDGAGNGDTDMLSWTETTFLNEGGSTALPASMGRPTAIQFLPTQDSATGVGDCLVFGQRGVESFTLSTPRDQWKATQFQRTALLSIGTTGHHSVAVVNEDIWFRSQDGWRSYRQARAQANEWTQVSMSTNVRKWVDTEAGDFLNYCSCIPLDNRLITTCTPYPNQTKPFNNGLLSLDFDILSTFGKVSNPAWDGHWADRTVTPEIGLRVTQLVEGTFHGQHRAFVFGLDAAGVNTIREIMREPIGGDTAGNITGILRSRAFEFNSPFNEKGLYGGDIWWDDITEPFTCSVSYKADRVPDYLPWYSFSGNPVDGVVQGDADITVPGFLPRAALPKPSDLADTLQTKRLYRRFFELQVEFEWTGRAAIRKTRAHAELETETGLNRL